MLEDSNLKKASIPSQSAGAEDEWGSSQRVGYEDRPFYQPRRVAEQRQGSRPLRVIGVLLVVAGLAWITYVATLPEGLRAMLKPGLPIRPVLVLAMGALVLLLEKLFK